MQQRLSDWPDCHIELRCSGCGGLPGGGVKLLRKRFGDPSFADLVPRLICKHCRAKFAPVYLVAGHTRTFCHGGSPDWAVELVPPPRP